MILAADVGGTKIHAALFDGGPDAPRKGEERLLRTTEVTDLPGVLRGFVRGAGVSPRACALGVAGPVLEEAVRGVNLPWTVSAREVSAALGGIPVRLLNDLEASGHGLDALDAADLVPVQQGRAIPGGNRALISPGTGLGESVLHCDGGRTVPVGSEGGHADFAARTDEEIDLLRFLRDLHGRVSVERVVSGPGIVNVFCWLRDSGRVEDDSGILARPGESEPAAAITRAGLDGRSRICGETLRVWVSALASEAANLVLRGFAVGGLFLGGGIPARMLPALGSDAFRESFRRKPPWEDLLSAIPVQVVTSPEVALRGAAVVALRGPGVR